MIYAAALVVAALCGGLALVVPDRARPVLVALALVLAGFLNAGWSAHRVAEPVLGFRYYGPVSGRIADVDRSNSGQERITLEDVVLNRVDPAKTPRKVRISLYYPDQFVVLEPGRRVMVTAHLSPPSGPVEPGGFDFRRHAWFLGLGAIGYAREPLLEFAPPDRSGAMMRLTALRLQLGAAIRARLEGQGGAFAAAILTGDRSAIAPDVVEVLRRSNLAHLLAISGLHMGLLVGFVFAAIRYGLALVPPVALRLPVRKLAAMIALVAAAAYLALSGANVATERAFIMVAVMLLAVLLDRRALTLRAVTLAASIVLLLRPVSLIEAGFQMSFAATAALVAAFAALRARGWMMSGRAWWRGVLRNIVMLALSSAIAGLATAPVAAFHFNRIAHFGLIANLASVPVMGTLVMPSAVMAILAAPFGLDTPFWALVGAGIDWILLVATEVANLDGAVGHVVKPPTMVLGLLALGGVVLVLLRGNMRLVGLVPIIAAFLWWGQGGRPDLLISENGRLLGLDTAEGRWLNRAKGSGFAARIWLENDGDAAMQDEAAARHDGERLLAARRIAYDPGKLPDIARLAPLCAAGYLVIQPRGKRLEGDCPQISGDDLAAHGAVAVSWRGDKARIVFADQIGGNRLWSR
ncbi:MAG: ComEC family competence protein [Rhodobacteraceae bacterium]|nr:ComEC family competence protein [Paracoccaceae bacterium]